MLGEIRIFGGQSIPAGWALCHGQTLSISENTDLYHVLGFTYGGDINYGAFYLPDMREANGVVPIHQGTGLGLTPRTLGQSIGANSVEITHEYAPPHTHKLMASADAANTVSPAGIDAVLAKGEELPGGITNIYSSGEPNAVMAAGALTTYGENTHHFTTNTMASRYVNFIIAINDTAESAPLIGEIGIFAYNDFEPGGWLPCDGQAVPIGSFDKLYNAIGDTYKRNPKDGTFFLPDLQVRAPSAPDLQGYLGHGTGSNVAYSLWPEHAHLLLVDENNSGTATNEPADSLLGFARFQGTTNNNVYAEPEDPSEDTYLNSVSVGSTGANDIAANTKNMQPYLGLHFCICYRS